MLNLWHEHKLENIVLIYYLGSKCFWRPFTVRQRIFKENGLKYIWVTNQTLISQWSLLILGKACRLVKSIIQHVSKSMHIFRLWVAIDSRIRKVHRLSENAPKIFNISTKMKSGNSRCNNLAYTQSTHTYCIHNYTFTVVRYGQCSLLIGDWEAENFDRNVWSPKLTYM
jgi:hypothetical protein